MSDAFTPFIISILILILIDTRIIIRKLESKESEE